MNAKANKKAVQQLHMSYKTLIKDIRAETTTESLKFLRIKMN